MVGGPVRGREGEGGRGPQSPERRGEGRGRGPQSPKRGREGEGGGGW